MTKAGLIIGIIVIIAMVIGFIPCLGWTFWVTLPVAIVGLILSLIGLLQDDVYARQNRHLAGIGLALNLITLVFGFFRWAAGGFIL
ncbi:MAG: hypothetical protein J0M37_08870 [Ignavibacteria bacterium]|nr:hypothetical protein [Ignavibacteria bacterium]